jgi:tRNA 2-thiouridine synthesizing protein A
MNFDKELDVKGLNCPMPIMKAKRALGEIAAGTVLKIVATDPDTKKDFIAFSKQTGNEIVSTSEGGGEFIYYLKKK